MKPHSALKDERTWKQLNQELQHDNDHPLS